MRLLEVRDLRVSFETERGTVRAVDGVFLEVEAGEIVGLVGETGCGKTSVALSLLGLCPGRVEGEALFYLREGRAVDLVRASPRLLSRLRGEEVALIFQEPGEALSPVYRVGEQLLALLRKHFPWKGRADALRLLEEAGLPPAAFHLYPHQMSLGMLRRAAIALAVSGRPRLLIADEPTAALDAVLGLHIVGLLSRLCRERGMSLLFISHDISLAFALCDRIAVMFRGRLWETASAARLRERPLPIYTQRLLASLPRPPQPFAPPPSFPEADSGCPFHLCCPHTRPLCREQTPTLKAVSADHKVACHAYQGDAL